MFLDSLHSASVLDGTIEDLMVSGAVNGISVESKFINREQFRAKLPKQSPSLNKPSKTRSQGFRWEISQTGTPV